MANSLNPISSDSGHGKDQHYHHILSVSTTTAKRTSNGKNTSSAFKREKKKRMTRGRMDFALCCVLGSRIENKGQLLQQTGSKLPNNLSNTFTIPGTIQINSPTLFFHFIQ
jgi:hypothetical protein